jgi:hypothetical protein
MVLGKGIGDQLRKRGREGAGRHPGERRTPHPSHSANFGNFRAAQ